MMTPQDLKGMRFGGVAGPASWFVTLTAVIFLVTRGHGQSGHVVLTSYLGLLAGVYVMLSFFLLQRVRSLEAALQAHHAALAHVESLGVDDDEPRELLLSSPVVDPGVVLTVHFDPSLGANGPPDNQRVRLLRLLVDPKSAAHFSIVEIVCGEECVLMGPIPAAAFECDRHIVPGLRDVSCMPADVRIVVENVSGSPCVFVGMVEVEVDDTEAERTVC